MIIRTFGVRILLLVLILTIVGSSAARADTLISFTDNNPALWMTSFFDNVVPNSLYAPQHVSVYGSWTQSVTATNVSVDALLSGGTLPSDGVAYLTNAVGPSATMANQIAFTTFTSPVLPNFDDANTLPMTSLFSGLTLGPGTYYLVFDAPAGLNVNFWVGDFNVTQNTAPGFAVGPYASCTGASFLGDGCSIPSFAPAASYTEWTDPTSMSFYRVQGTVVPDAPVPEPATILLLASGALGGIRRFWKRAR